MSLRTDAIFFPVSGCWIECADGSKPGRCPSLERDGILWDAAT